MLKLLETHEIPFAQEGEIIYPVGTWSKPNYQDRQFKVIETQPTSYALGVNSPNAPTGNFVLPADGVLNPILLDDKLEPQSEDIINQIRVGLKRRSGLALYALYLSGTIRGGLQKPSVIVPDPSDLVKRYLGAYTYKHTSEARPRLQLWWTQGKTPAFAVANWSKDYEKVILTFLIQKMRIKPISREEFQAGIARGTRIHYLYSESTMTV